MVPRAAAMGKPAQDHPVTAEHLHAIDADIDIERVVGRARDHQRPGDQRCRFARPTPLDGQTAKIDVGATPDGVLA
ncbi:hypothetical protein FQZ97_1089720 [compost metagenome]